MYHARRRMQYWWAEEGRETEEVRLAGWPAQAESRLRRPERSHSVFADYDWNIDENDVLKTKPTQPNLTVICSGPARLVISELGSPVGSIDLSDALSKLSKLNNDLHTRMAAIESHRSVLTLRSILFREGPLYIGNLTVDTGSLPGAIAAFQQPKMPFAT
ncbi:C6 zinc finger domain [Fusarium agapanthi]|uniref:C6 zinc finger domain n=1 Tax=Fusarium agapanthi TaxID=1803897 RepID=A0A9P5E5B3_9HYPO|nr:C6 zinc finger domain [Fusarium agapanthi]